MNSSSSSPPTFQSLIEKSIQNLRMYENTLYNYIFSTLLSMLLKYSDSKRELMRRFYKKYYHTLVSDWRNACKNRIIISPNDYSYNSEMKMAEGYCMYILFQMLDEIDSVNWDEFCEERYEEISKSKIKSQFQNPTIESQVENMIRENENDYENEYENKKVYLERIQIDQIELKILDRNALTNNIQQIFRKIDFYIFKMNYYTSILSIAQEYKIVKEHNFARDHSNIRLLGNSIVEKIDRLIIGYRNMLYDYRDPLNENIYSEPIQIYRSKIVEILSNLPEIYE
jgi:hypothetical protein